MRIDGIHDITCITADDEPPRPAAARIPPEHALLGFAGVRAYSRTPAEAERLLTHELGCTLTAPGTHALAGGWHHATHAHDAPPLAVGIKAARRVHHIAWCDRDAEHATWEEHLIRIGVDPTPVIDRQSFLSIYFYEPRGVLFELATPSPGFTVDEDPEHLGEALRLPPHYEHLRSRLERLLTSLENPRAAAERPA